ncbi:MAG: Fur family transcriptional regulator [Polyangiaceae bacterium]
MAKPANNQRELREALRTAGLRATIPRVRVLSALGAATTPLSHGDIADGLAEEGFDRATVYRNLIDLTDAGLVRRSDLGDHVWRFELASGDHHEHDDSHAHFVCASCGAVECLPVESVTLSPTRGAPKALKGSDLEIQVRGLCDSCA